MHVLDMLAAGAEERSHTVRSGNQLWSSFGKYQSYEIICCKIWYRNEFSVHHVPADFREVDHTVWSISISTPEARFTKHSIGSQFLVN